MYKEYTTRLSLFFDDIVRVVSSLDLSGLANKDVMITGANGLIGINFLLTFIKIAEIVPGIKIIPVVHSEPSLIPESYFHSKNVFFIKGDLTDEKFCKKLPDADIIIHAAGSGEPSRFVLNPISSLKINTLTVFCLFEKIRFNGRFLFISSSDIYNGLTSSIYGEHQIGTSNTDHPRACYIEGKRNGEAICNIYRQKGYNAFSVRLSLTYGPGMRLGDNRVLPSFIQKGIRGGIDLLDSGNSIRTFCYVSDAIELMLYILMHGKERLYNVGGITSCKISELANMVGQICNVPVIIPSVETGLEGAPKNVTLDLSRVFTEYPKKDFMSLEEGLLKTIKWFKLLSK